MSRAVCLLSGGLDSCVAAAWAGDRGDDLVALTARYGQVHDREVRAAAGVADALDADHLVVDLPLDRFGGSSLLGEGEIEDRETDEIGEAIPSTYVPARNTVLIAVAASLAEARGADRIVIGANVRDYSGYPDCRPEYLEAMERALALGTKRGVEGDGVAIAAPVLELDKAGIVELGVDLDAPLERTWSCYRGGEAPCGACDACKLREKGFAEAGIEDPALR